MVFAGSITNAYIKGITKAGIEGSNNGDDGNLEPVTNATISNVTMVVDGLEILKVLSILKKVAEILPTLTLLWTVSALE